MTAGGPRGPDDPIGSPSSSAEGKPRPACSVKDLAGSADPTLPAVGQALAGGRWSAVGAARRPWSSAASWRRRRSSPTTPAATSIRLEPIGADVRRPTSPPGSTSATVGGSLAIALPDVPPLGAGVGERPGRHRSVAGDEPGLYGGSRDIGTCDVEQLVAFLTDPANRGQGRGLGRACTTSRSTRSPTSSTTSRRCGCASTPG